MPPAEDRRYSPFLRARYRVILGYLGDGCLLVSLVVLSPLLLFPFHREENAAAWALLLAGLAAALLGVALRARRDREAHATLNFQEGSVLVMLSWIVAIGVGTVPFLAVESMTLPRAVFESVSGWTTTGLSVMDVAATPRLLLAYRSVLQLAGGAGFAVIVLSSLGGPTGTGLGTAEGRADLLVPNMRRSARLVLVLYAGYAAAGILGLRGAGMDWFDALNHSFAAVSTGGFSTRPESIGAWDDPAVEGVCIVLMLLGSTNFLSAWTLFRGRAGLFARNGEVRLAAFLLPAAAAVLFAGVTVTLYSGLGKAARVAIFEAASALTTTGFSSVGYGDWNSLGWTVLLLLMVVGGGTGSTAGGLKQYRVYALWKALHAEVRRMFLPAAVSEPSVWVGERRRFLRDADLRSLGVYVALYLGTLGLGTAALAACGYTLRDALFEFASAQGTVGLSSGVTTPALEGAPLWILCGGMFLGRLEFLIVFLFAVKMAQHIPVLLRR